MNVIIIKYPQRQSKMSKEVKLLLLLPLISFVFMMLITIWDLRLR